MSKIHHMKEVMKYLGVFRREFRARQDVSDGIKTIVSLIEDDIQNSSEKVIYLRRKHERLFWLNRDGEKQFD